MRFGIGIDIATILQQNHVQITVDIHNCTFLSTILHSYMITYTELPLSHIGGLLNSLMDTGSGANCHCHFTEESGRLLTSFKNVIHYFLWFIVDEHIRNA